MGMYTNPLFVYREYIQNAADAIDEAVAKNILSEREDGRIEIIIDPQARLIKIEDNATGIPKLQVPTFLRDVAKSTKNPATQKGFRGIGRLGGLGYCGQLIFETSYRGEPTKSIIKMDAARLRRLIADIEKTVDAAQVISLITTFEAREEKADDHYFHVTMKDVITGEPVESLLNESEVKDYLSMTAPVAFQPNFDYSERIHTFFKEKGMPLEEYIVEMNLNEEPIYKAYDTKILKLNGGEAGQIIDVDVFTLNDNKGEPLAIGWYGLTNLLNKAIPPNNLFRGIRIKKNNITIGDENTLKDFFEADRFNLHFAGEVHVRGREFVPNARRDNFNESEIVSLFRRKLKDEFKKLVKLSRFSSDVWSRYRDIKKFWEEKKSFVQFKSKPPISEVQVKHRERNLADARKKAQAAKSKLEKLEKNNVDDLNARAVFQTIMRDADLEITDSDADLDFMPSSGGFRLEQELSKLDSKTRSVLLTVFEILDNGLWGWEVERIERLKLKIAEKLVLSESK